MAPRRKDPEPTLTPGTREAENATPTLVSTIERIESLKEEQADLAEQIRSEMASIKGMGFDTKIVRKVLARRARSRSEVEEEDMLVDTYERAIRETKDLQRAADEAATAKRKPATAASAAAQSAKTGGF